MSKLEDAFNDYVDNGLDGLDKFAASVKWAAIGTAEFFGEGLVWLVSLVVLVLLLPFALFNYWRKDA